jgi:hypothetical protein
VKGTRKEAKQMLRSGKGNRGLGRATEGLLRVFITAKGRADVFITAKGKADTSDERNKQLL